jgi:hypothetical protein
MRIIRRIIGRKVGRRLVVQILRIILERMRLVVRGLICTASIVAQGWGRSSETSALVPWRIREWRTWRLELWTSLTSQTCHGLGWFERRGMVRLSQGIGTSILNIWRTVRRRFGGASSHRRRSVLVGWHGCERLKADHRAMPSARAVSCAARHG